MLKTRYWKELWQSNNSSFSLQEFISDSIIYSAFKNRKLDTLSFYFAFKFLRSHQYICNYLKINFYFVLGCYSYFYFFIKHIANLKIFKLKRKKYLARYMGDAPPPS
jgi:hypothetical protein